jgi:hypothetical protein
LRRKPLQDAERWVAGHQPFVGAAGGPVAVTIEITLSVLNFRAGGAYRFGDVLPAVKPLLWVRIVGLISLFLATIS